MLSLQGLHHIAIICADYQRSRIFYTNMLGFKIVREVYREERKSWKLDLSLGDEYLIELFSFPDPPPRPSRPEACGLRHLAFKVENLEPAVNYLRQHQIDVEDIRVDEHTGNRFTFFADPDGLPIELYECA